MPAPHDAAAGGSAAPSRASRFALSALAWACVAVFAGRALQHGFGEPPFRELLWNQPWVEPWVRRILGMEWNAYATSPQVDAVITGLIHAFAGLYAACACACLPWGRWPRWRFLLIGAGALSLFGLSCLYSLERFLRMGEVLEPASQWMAPVLLLLCRARVSRPRLAGALARFAVAGTFLGHGAYAIGYYPVPGPFVDMVILHFGVGEAAAVRLLHAWGAIDLVVAAAMALPFRAAKPFLAYAVFWGAVTALARFGYLFDRTQAYFGAVFFLPEILCRVPHAVVPLWLLLRGAPRRAPAG